MSVNYKRVKQTQKKKKQNKSKTAIWGKFDDMMGKNDVETMECLYTKQKIGTRTHCDQCKSRVAYEERFLTCTNSKCGIIYKDNLDESAEWRYYGADDSNQTDPTRCGMPINPLLEESSYGCKVLCPGNSSYEMRKIRRYTEWQSMPYKEKSQYDEFQKIQTLSRQAGIPKIIIDEALRYHKKISEMKTFRGCNRDGIIAASIYIASRIHDYPRTAKEIATIFNLDNTSATKGCKNAVHLVNQIEKNMENNDKTHFHKTTPISFIERYCSKLGINKELTKVCLFVANRIQKANKIPENTPHSVAAGIIYFVAQSCKLNISKRAVNNISEISEVTINKCYKKLNRIHDEEKLIPKCILNKYSD
jgi:transcription initiation factor TFIIB